MMADGVFGHVYIVTNKVNGKQYVGITTQEPRRRWGAHINGALRGDSPCVLFARALIKYGRSNFEFSVIDVAYDRIELFDKEVHYIKQFNTKKPNGYNLTDGGAGLSGNKNSMETVAKRSETIKSRNGNRIIADYVEYRSVADAARALGVSDATIKYRLQCNFPGYEIIVWNKPNRRVPSRAVIVFGVMYESLSACDRYNGFTPGTTRRRIVSGWSGYLYAEGNSKYQNKKGTKGHCKRKGVMVDNVAYCSIKSAQSATGYCPATIHRRISRGRPGYAYINVDVDKEAA